MLFFTEADGILPVGFFDHSVQPAVAFESVDDLLSIKPVGGGGTSFDVIFRYVHGDFIRENEEPATIIILTDGFAQYLDEAASRGIPVLWLINNEKSTPPWGTVARIEI